MQHILFWLVLMLGVTMLCVATYTRKKGYVDGDIIIGVLFPIHKTPTIDRTSTRECGEIRETYGMHRIEVLLKTVNEINHNPAILPGISLGVDIRDTCMYVPIALEQSIDFIKNSFTHQDKLEVADGANDGSNYDQTGGNQGDGDHEDSNQGSGKSIASLIGAADSTVSMQVQNLLQLFKIPQISYSATAIDLSKKELYKYFMRVVQSDLSQAKALADLIAHYKWEFISLVYTQDTYGTMGHRELDINIKKNSDICTDQVIELDNNLGQEIVTEKVRKLFDNDRAKVIVCFCQGETIEKLFTAMNHLNRTKKGFLIIGTDGWADRQDVLGKIIDKESGVYELSSVIHGGVSIRLSSLPIADFDEYFRSKNYSNTPGNPWFQEFWEQHFRCRATNISTGKYERRCHGNESLFNTAYTQDTKLGFVVKSVMTVANGLHNLNRKLCPTTNVRCKKFFRLNGTALLEEMLNVSFVAYDNETVKFDHKGDPPGRYEILNYQRHIDNATGRIEYHYQKIGTWKDGTLKILSEVQWPPSSSDNGNTGVKSYCSEPCKVGEVREVTGSKKCCWRCKPCSEYEYIVVNVTGETCVKCHEVYRPYKNKTGCFKIEPEYEEWSNATSIIAVVFSCIGTLASIVVIVIFALYNETPVVKSSTRELMYIILTGIIMCYCTTFPMLAKPTMISCFLSRIMPGLSFTMVFGALATKTNRICRILSTSKKKIIHHKGRFLTTSAQIIITAILIVIEMIIIAVMIYLEFPKPCENIFLNERVFIICFNPNIAVLISFGFNAVLICLCTWYAFKTRNLPENFNEAKYIGFTMYTICIIWIGLIPIYFGTNYEVISMCIAIDLCATTALVLLFFPKIYIILYRPEKNDRSAFTTTTDIQCHIGPQIGNYQIANEKRKKSEMELKIYRDISRSSLYDCHIIDYSCNIFTAKIGDNFNSDLSTRNISVQTEPILIMECQTKTTYNESTVLDGLSATQLALLHFLEEHWTSLFIPEPHAPTPAQSTLRSTDLDTVRYLYADEDEYDENDVQDEDSSNVLPSVDHVISGTTNSPLSNISTDASSTISTMFLEYLKIQGRQFCKNKHNRSIKL